MPETLLEALRSLAKARGHESPDIILARHAPIRDRRQPRWWLQKDHDRG